MNAFLGSVGATAIVPLVALVAGFIAGAVVDAVMLRRLPFYAALRGAAVVLGGIVGLQLALPALPEHVRENKRIEELLSLLAVVLVTIVANRAAGFLIDRYTRRHPEVMPSASLFVSVSRIVVVTIGILVMLDTVGISVAPLLTALGVGGLAVALALRDTLANLFSGLQLLASRQVRPGDFVQIAGGLEGYIIDVTWRTTVLRDIAGAHVVVPNQALAGATFTNGSVGGLLLAIPLAAGLSADPAVVREATLAATTGVLRAYGLASSTPPALRFRGVGDTSIGFSIVVATPHPADTFELRDRIIEAVLEALRARGCAPFAPPDSLEKGAP